MNQPKNMSTKDDITSRKSVEEITDNLNTRTEVKRKYRD